MRGAQQVLEVDLLVLVVEDRRLHGALEELVGVAAEELVERVLAGDVDLQPAATPPRSPPHLAQGGHRARERDADRRVQRTDVDAQLERVGGHDAEQLALDQPALELAPLPGGVARPVGRDPLGQRRVALRAQPRGRVAGDQLDRLARLDEADRPRAALHQVGEQVGRLGERRAPRPEVLVEQRRVPDRGLAHRLGRAVAVDQRDLLEPGQPLGQLDRVGDRRRGEQDAGLGPVGVGHTAKPAQDVGDVRPEHAAIDVRLVDDHHREVREQVGPRAVVGKDPDVEHVGVGEHDIGPAPDGRALGARGVAVVDRRPDAPGQAERVERARLVLGQRLGRVEVQARAPWRPCTGRRASAG